MAALVAEPKITPSPISLDHAVVRCVDVGAGFEFASCVMGLKESARIVAPDGIPVLGFFRCHTIFHCYAVARSQYNGLHHMQFTLKNPLAVHAAFEKMRDRGKVELIWGPLRHGAGHNIVFYFRDYTGNIVEYSAEEEIILNDATYVPRVWPVTDPRAGDEWEPIPHTARDDVILAPESRIMDHRRQELEQELPAASVIAFNTSVVRAATTAILAVPTRIAPRVVGLKAAAQVESIIRGVIVEVLQGLSKLEVLPASGHTTTRADEAV